MKLFRLVFLIIMFCLTLNAKQSTLNAGILYLDMISSKEESLIGTEIWKKDFENKFSDRKINLILYENEERLIEDYKALKINTVVADLNFYYKYQSIIDKISNYKFVVSQSKTQYEQFYLIKNKKNNTSFDDKKVNEIYFRNRVEKSWFESIVLKSNYDKNILKKLKRIEKKKRLIFNIFFNKSNFSIVSKVLYDSMVELNPQIKSEIEIVKKSEPIFFISCGFSRNDEKNNFDGTILREFEKDLNNKENFYNSMSYNSIQSIFLIEEEFNEHLTKFYKEYFELIKQYKIK